jgi:thiol-disulfide isomerase/thioredoxin
VIRSLLIQIVVFVVIFNTFSWFKETSMLSTDTKISSAQNTLPTLMDTTIELQSGKTKTVVYFFAPWCQVCHFSIDNLQKFYLKNENINVIAVALDYSDKTEVTAFVKQHDLTFPIALGNEQVKQKFSITGYPSYYVIDEHNTVVAKSLGYSSEIGMYLRTL